MKLVETIELTQEYIDDSANYTTNSLYVNLSNPIVTEGYIEIFIPAPEEWRTSKPGLYIPLNKSVGGSNYLVQSAKLEPTNSYKNCYLFAHVLCADKLFMDVVFCKYYSDDVTSPNQITRYFNTNRNAAQIQSIGFRFSPSTNTIPAGTTIKIYSE